MLDFAQIKSDNFIGDVAYFYLATVQDGDVLRAPCPQCAPRNPRAILVTPEKNLYYCFAGKKGGDVISLVAHVQGISQRKAAELLAQKQHKPDNTTEVSDETLQPLSYLDAEHSLVSEIGFSKEVCEKVGIGYASKGLMRTNVAIPIRLPDGTLVGYVGVKTAQLPPKWRLP